jgi:transposase-like protein
VTKPTYPGNLLEFTARFQSDEVCLQYLIENRWPEGFICPACEATRGWWLGKYRRFECRNCHRQTSPLAGTLMHDSHLPLRLWFWAAYWVTTHTPGISAVQLQRQLGIAKYDTAWFLLHRLRQGMVREEREPLSGEVEADETHVGGPAEGRRGRGVAKASHKSLVIGAVEIRSITNKVGKTIERAGRLRLQEVASAREEKIKTFLNKNVVKGSAIKSDGWKGYSSLALEGYHHIRQVQGIPQRAGELAPHIHQVFGNLKAWLLGIHHGVDPKYLQAYLDEFVFRFNRRGHPMAAFRSLLGIVTTKNPITLQQLKKP